MNLFKKTQEILLYLLVVGLLTSMALISSAANLLSLVVTIGWIAHSWSNTSIRNYWLKLGPDVWVLAHFIAVLGGALLIEGVPNVKEKWGMVNEAKWIWFLYAMAASLTMTKIHTVKIVKLFSVLVIPVALYGIFQTFTGLDPVHNDSINRYILSEAQFLWRARGFFRNPLTYAYNLGIIVCFLLPFILYRVYNHKTLTSKLLKFAVGLGAIAFALSFTRGAWLAVALTATMMLYLWDRRTTIKIVPIATVILVVGLFLTPGFKHRMESFMDFKTFSISLRFKMWESSWEMFKDNPLLGVGNARVSKRMQEYNERLHGERFMPINAHNNFLDVLAGTGILGFIPWLFLMFLLLRDSFRRFRNSTAANKKAIHLGAIGAQICFHIGGLTQSTFLDREPLILFCLIVCLSLTAEIRDSGQP